MATSLDFPIEDSPTPSTSSSARKPEDIFKILVATDIHLGYCEKDPIRAEDTFDTFEEILQIAVENDVDFILLGGDLFHVASPSPYALQRCIELLHKYCMGDKPVEVELLSDPTHNFSNALNKNVNYECPNLNIAIPVFSIHGNHDDPVGSTHTSAMNLIASTGLLNYFGRYNNHEHIEIEPVLLRKGETFLAMYGLSHVRDERLGRMFLEKKVKMATPTDVKNWFNLLIWHQNRAARGNKNFIPETSLATFLDLVIWGHEHDNRLKPERIANDVYISQPGSSVATSLSQGESIPKQVGILSVWKKEFIMTPIDLKTVRPFIYKEIHLDRIEKMKQENDNKPMKVQDMIMKTLDETLESMIAESKTLGRVGNAAKLPLIRLNVRYFDEKHILNAIRYGQTFKGKVANPEDMVKFIRRSEKKREGSTTADFENVRVSANERLEDMMNGIFAEENTLELLPYTVLNAGLKQAIDTDSVDALTTSIQNLQTRIKKKMEQDMPELVDLKKYFADSKETMLGEELPVIPTTRAQVRPDPADNIQMDLSDDDEPAPRPTRGPGSRGGQRRTPRGSRGRGGRGRKQQKPDDDF